VSNEIQIDSYPRFPKFENFDVELEFIIENFAKWGVKLNPIFTLSSLKNMIIEWELESLESEELIKLELEKSESEIVKKSGYELAEHIFLAMGYTWFNPHNRNINECVNVSNNVWYRDMEFGSEVRYDDMLLALNRLTNYELDLQNIENRFSWESGLAGLSFKFNGNLHNFEFKFNGDWADFAFFEQIGEVIKPFLKKNFYSVQGGQGHIIVYLTREEMIGFSNFLYPKEDGIPLLF
jgi:hypothetical protein